MTLSKYRHYLKLENDETASSMRVYSIKNAIWYLEALGFCFLAGALGSFTMQSLLRASSAPMVLGGKNTLLSPIEEA